MTINAIAAHLASIDPPRWVWAALLMAAFVSVSVATILLARYPVRRQPPPGTMKQTAGETDPPPRDDA